jgi:hypothetical protein
MSHFLEECMAEDAFVYYKFKNRKTGELIDAVLAFKNVEDHDPALKKFFDIHEYKIVEKRLYSMEDNDKWRKEIKPSLKNY